MTTHKHIDRICCIAVILAMLITVLFMNADSLGIQAAAKVMGYEERLFDAENVHTIDIIIDDWDAFLSTCQSEEYSVCNVLIDGEAYTNVGIRGKGNTSLSTVSSMNSDRYSFKIEFDQYDSTKSYYGLDKLCLNNIIQDNTYMKDFLVYQMMAEFGVDAPLCSYVYITVNGEDWGLYLAVEGVEDSFLQRNYGSDYGELYKPDSMSFGGGRGNGKDFNMEEFDFSQFGGSGSSVTEDGGSSDSGNSGSFDSSVQNPFGDMFGGEMPDMGDMPQGGGFPGGNMEMPEDMELPGMTIPEGSGMGSSDVKLQYIDDEASSYSNIFDNAKTDISEADRKRLIESLKALSEGEEIESVVDIEEVIRYFVVHNFVVNGDSYTGSMIHNYYLYEEDGQLSMIPWDYNLAYGTFQGNNAESAVNDPIDSPVSGGTDDRPMIDWIFGNEEYTELYHEYFAEFIAKFFDDGKLTELIDYTAELIAPYVEKDPTKFCTYEEFETGVATIREFCQLRAESVSGQLAGTIPSTSDGQAADSSNLIDASEINLSDMGTMNMGGGSFGGGNSDRENFGGENRGNRGEISQDMGNMQLPEGTEMPDKSNMPQGGNFPGGNMQMPNMGGNRGSSSNEEESSGEGGSSSQFPNKGNIQMPDGMGFGGSGYGSSSAASPATIILLVASVIILLIGLLVAYKFKR